MDRELFTTRPWEYRRILRYEFFFTCTEYETKSRLAGVASPRPYYPSSLNGPQPFHQVCLIFQFDPATRNCSIKSKILCLHQITSTCRRGLSTRSSSCRYEGEDPDDANGTNGRNGLSSNRIALRSHCGFFRMCEIANSFDRFFLIHMRTLKSFC